MWDNVFTPLQKGRPRSDDTDNPDTVYVVPPDVREGFPDVADLQVWDGNGELRHAWSLKNVTFLTVVFPKSPTDRYVYVATQEDYDNAVNQWQFDSPVS